MVRALDFNVYNETYMTANINAIITISGASAIPTGNHYYWSCSEQGKEATWAMFFKDGGANGGYKDTASGTMFVRSVIAF